MEMIGPCSLTLSLSPLIRNERATPKGGESGAERKFSRESLLGCLGRRRFLSLEPGICSARLVCSRQQTPAKWRGRKGGEGGNVVKGGNGTLGEKEEKGRWWVAVVIVVRSNGGGGGRKLKTNLMDITELEFPAEVQNMRALE